MMNTLQLKDALRIKYPSNEWVLLTEVQVIDGYKTRYADIVAMNLWRSRGYNVVGFELKVSRNDWLHEKKDPSKADPIFKYCDYFYLAVGDSNIIKDDEIPDNWGLIIPCKNGLRIKKKAPKLNSIEPNREFIASMLRRARDQVSEESVINKRISNEVDKQLKEYEEILNKDKEILRENYNNLIHSLNDFKNKTGIDIYNSFTYNNYNDDIHLIKFLKGGNIDGLINKIVYIQSSLKSVNNQLELLIKEQRIKRFPRPIGNQNE